MQRRIGIPLALGLILSLAGCGHMGTTPAPTAQLMVGGKAVSAQSASELMTLPHEVFVPPSRPTRGAHLDTEGNAGKLFISPAETLPAVKRLISEAQHSVYIEVFNFGNDSYGKQLVPLLCAQARAGLEVKVLMDQVGSKYLPDHEPMVKALKDAGVEVVLYRSAIVLRRLGAGLNVTHRKVYLADGDRGLVGGVNLQAPFDTTTHDLLIEWRGPVVGQLYEEYGLDWKRFGGSDLKQEADPTPVAGGMRARVAVTSSREGRYEIQDAVYRAVDNAQRTIDIENQYLWDDALIDRLLAAMKRGVKLRVIVPGKEFTGKTAIANMEDVNRLVKAGAQAREYNGEPTTAHLHTKYFAVDDQWAATGSCNGDTRGFIDNQELDMLIRDQAFNVQLRERLFEADWASHSIPFQYVKAPFYKRPFRSLIELIDYFM
jgi:cardiolipin synthase